jgi:hypothetical protein
MKRFPREAHLASGVNIRKEIAERRSARTPWSAEEKFFSIDKAYIS